MFRVLAVMSAVMVLAACSKDDNGGGGGKQPSDTPHQGTYVLSEGSIATCGVLTYISESGEVIDSVYAKNNPGHKLGSACQAMDVYGNYLYVLSQNGDSKGGDGYLVVINLDDFKRVTAYTNAEWPELKTPKRLRVINANKAYITCANKGIYVANLAEHKIDGLIANTASVSDTPMLLLNGKVFAGMGSDNTLAVIDTQTDAVVKTVEMPAKVTNVIASKDGNVWVSCGANIVKVNASTYSTQQYALTGVTPAGYDGIGLSESLDGKALFFTNPAWGAENTHAVYKFTPEDGRTDIFVDLASSSQSSGNEIYGPTGVHPKTGDLYVLSQKGYTVSSVWVYDSATGGAPKQSYVDKTWLASDILFYVK